MRYPSIIGLGMIIILALFAMVPSAVALDAIGCSTTKTGNKVCVELEKSSLLDQLFTITGNTGTNLVEGSVARFTLSQAVKYNCPLPFTDLQARIYVFNKNDLNTYADNAVVQIKGDDLAMACGDTIGLTFWYNTIGLPVGSYRLYAQIAKFAGNVITDSEYISFSLYKSIEAPLVTPMPPGGTTTYTPPPIFTPTPFGTPNIIIINQTSPPISGGGFNVNTTTLLAIALVGAGIFMFMRRK